MNQSSADTASTASQSTNGVEEAANDRSNGEEVIERLGDDCILIAGGGPVGLVLATVLASYGVKSIILERNKGTTRWPKMDLTNARSMELFRKLGLANALRKEGVPSQYPYSVKISRTLHEDEAVTQWPLASVDEYREIIAKQNDGTLPLEPYQRLSQAVFEAWLKGVCDQNPLIEARFGWKVESTEELESSVRIVATQVDSGKKRVFLSQFLAGCDGSSSRVRRDLQINLDGGPVPSFTLLIHFKSRDLTRLHRQGRFWHIFFLEENAFRGAIIAQDEKETWTTHLHIPLGTDHNKIDSYDAVYTVLGGWGKKYEIKIDEILVRSTYRPSIAIARHYSSPRKMIHLAGDAAHQNIPTGGYGMNMGLGDAFDLGWKLGAVINKWGGPALLSSYEEDRRAVALVCIERSGVHNSVHRKGAEILGADGPCSEMSIGNYLKTRDLVHQHYQLHDGENKDLGIEMGYRYKSAICISDAPSEEPDWLPSRYVPSTWPGSRAPHVFLNDGRPIYDLYGTCYSLVDFSPAKQNGVQNLLDVAENRGLPLKHVPLCGEDHARQLWERDLVIIRPDGHVAWRGNTMSDQAAAVKIIETISGYGVEINEALGQRLEPEEFSSVGKVTTQSSEYELENMGEFQR